MTKLADILLRCGAKLPLAASEDLPQSELSGLFEHSVGVEKDADGSRRLRLREKHSQLVRTPDSELVLVHAKLEQETSDYVERVVCARTPEKAANELAKLRLWRAAEAGLRHIGAIGKPDRPADLADWKLQNQEIAERLQRQLDAIGLAAEKTHQFSSQVFEPALLAPLEPRIASFRKAVALFFVAEVLRSRIVSETRKRLERKKYADSEARSAYLAARAELDLRAAELYSKASGLFTKSLAGALARHCSDLAESCAENVTVEPSSPDAGPAPIKPLLHRFVSQSEYEEAKRTIEPADATLRNTVRTINGLNDPATRAQLERFFAGQLVDIARRLRAPAEVAALLKKVRDLARDVSAKTHITPRHLDQYVQLIARERPDLGPPSEL